MTVSFEWPRAITDQAAGSDLAAMAKEALLVELYREGKITSISSALPSAWTPTRPTAP